MNSLLVATTSRARSGMRLFLDDCLSFSVVFFSGVFRLSMDCFDDSLVVKVVLTNLCIRYLINQLCSPEEHSL